MESIKSLNIPVVALRGLVLFPGMTLHFDVGRKTSSAALRAALEGNQDIFLVTQRDINEEEPQLTGLYPVGVVAELRQVFRIQEGTTYRVIVEGKYRATIDSLTQTKPYLMAEIRPRIDTPVKSTQKELSQALVRRAKSLFEEYSELSPKIAPDVLASIEQENRPGVLADIIAAAILLPMADKQSLLTQKNPLSRIEQLCVILTKEVDILRLEEDIQDRVQEQIDSNQREYYLREQLKIISEELHEGDSPTSEADSYARKINASKMPEESKKKLFEENNRLRRMSPASPDSAVIRTYLDRCLALPWGIYSKDKTSLATVRRVLEKEHYGLEKVKERITEMLAARFISKEIKGQIICLAGPPGVGKTSIAKSVASALGRKYVRISLGGIRDEAEIRGHRRTYVGAIPGRIITAVTNAGTANPLILLDEIDKLGGDFRGDPASALLEVLDAEQNFAFADHYIEIPFDLSQVLFLTTANDVSAIPEPLRDRMEIIELSSYTAEEKFNIAKRHLVPKQLKQHGLTRANIRITDKALRLMIEGYTREAGVRRLERLISKLCRKEAVRLADGIKDTLVVDHLNLQELLGPVKFKDDPTLYDDQTGIANGLAWTSVGGEMLQIEVAVMEGTGKIELTGKLGEVMKESARTAVSYLRSKAEQLGIDSEFYKTKDIHIHVPEGAVPKDGPSAGVTIATALLSALTGKKVNGKVAMTGEITLRGRVLPIGGLREKTMAAYRTGMTTVLIPHGNLSDLKEIDKTVEKALEFIPVRTLDEVFDHAILTDKAETGMGEIHILNKPAVNEGPAIWT
ncbi:MAG: endopeptidase La [Clostridiales bacterium]|nr:endopeptidase La [Clostridiales bacterium]